MKEHILNMNEGRLIVEKENKVTNPIRGYGYNKKLFYYGDTLIGITSSTIATALSEMKEACNSWDEMLLIIDTFPSLMSNSNEIVNGYVRAGAKFEEVEFPCSDIYRDKNYWSTLLNACKKRLKV